MSNVITAYFKGRTGVAEAVYQNDYGMVMAFDGIYLPAHFDCYFSVSGSEEAIPGIGADNRVAIPNAVLAVPGKVEIHIPMHTGENNSEVEYVVYFKVINRSRPVDDGTPVQMTAIEQALALLQNPIGNIEAIVEEALSFTGETFEEMQEDLTEWKGGVEEGLDTWKDGVEDGIDTFETQVMTMVGTPLVAGTVAGMTDHSKIYVYTGSETGYTAGNWYYWNGSAWTSGGTYNSTAFTTDTTLTASGAAADSKTVGDKVSALKEDFVGELDGKLPYFLVKNQYIKTDGSFSNYSGWDRTEYIPVKDIYSITVKSSSNSGYNAFYKADKTFLITLNVTTTETELLVPKSASYVAFSNTAAGMSAFSATFKDKQGKEIEILNKMTTDLEVGNIPFKLVKNEYVNAYGDFAYEISYARTGHVFIGTASELTINSQGSSIYNAIYDSNKNFIKAISISSGNNVIEIPSNAFYIALSNEFDKMMSLTMIKTKERERYYNYNFVENEYVDPSDGSFPTESGWSRTELIPINQFKGIRVKSSVNSNYNAFYKKDKTVHSRFNVKTTETCIAIPDGAYYVAFSNTNAGMQNFTVNFTDNGIYSYPDVPRTVYSYDNNFSYSIQDEIISFDGSITGTTFRLDLPNIVLDGYSILNVETVDGDYTGNVFILLLPTTTPAYILSVKGHITRLDHFNNEERGIAIYVPSDTTFSNLKFRVWVTQGLVNEPYNKQTPSAVGLSASEYNVSEYPRIGDSSLYNIFGNSFSACKDGLLSRANAEDTVKFGLLADLHYTDHENFYKRIYEKLSEEHVDFCLMLGDIIDSGYFSYPELCSQQMAQFNNSIQYLLAPNFPFCGNHDDDVSAFAHHGTVDFGDIRFIYLWADYDGGTEGGNVKPSELTWVGQQLAQSKAKTNILMCHYSVSTDPGFGYQLNSEAISAIETLASTYDVKLFLNGHEHDHNVSVGSAGVMTDINLPNGQYAYCICTITPAGAFTATVYDSETDNVLKTINVSLSN